MAFEMGEMPASFGKEMAAAIEADAREHGGIDQSAVDEAIGEMFAQAGVTDPESEPQVLDQAPPAGDEPAGDMPASSQEPSGEGQQPPGEQETPPPPAPGGPLYQEPDISGDAPAAPLPPAAQTITLPDGTIVTPQELAAYAELKRRIDTNPDFRQGVSDLINRQQPPPPAPQQQYPPLPQLSEEDLESPAIQALVMLAERQRQETARLAELVQATQREVETRQVREHTDIIVGAVSAFQANHNLPDALMGEIRKAASRTNAMDRYMAGEDPRTGTPVEPDLYKAAEAALEIGYWMVPSARQFEFERQSANQSAALTRKQKLAGIGGTSGSGPRQPQPPDTSTQAGRDAAAIALLAAAMNGSEEGDQ